jgi:hypothetical protein
MMGEVMHMLQMLFVEQELMRKLDEGEAFHRQFRHLLHHLIRRSDHQSLAHQMA